jgi:sugar phosphate permease
MRDPGHGTIRTRTKAPGGSFRVVLATPSAMMLCGVFFCATFVTSGITTWAPTFLDRELHLSLTQSTLYGASTVNAASLMGVLCSGGVADWAVARTKVARFYVLAIGLALASAALLPLGWLSTAGTIGLCFLGAGFFKGIFDGTIYAAMHDVVPPAARATAVGLMTTIGFAGAGLAPLLIGAASQSLRLGMALSLTAALYAIAAVVLVVFHRRAARDIAAVAA